MGIVQSINPPFIADVAQRPMYKKTLKPATPRNDIVQILPHRFLITPQSFTSFLGDNNTRNKAAISQRQQKICQYRTIGSFMH